MRLFRKKSMRKTVDWIASSLMIAGAINWGLVGIPAVFGFASFNLVEVALRIPLLINITYSLVGLSGGYVLFRNSDFMK